MSKKEYILTEYHIDESNMIFIFPSLSFDSFEKIMEHVKSRWNKERTYMTHEEGSNESYIKSVTDDYKLFHIVEKEIL